MSIKTRRVLFYSLVILFIVVGTLVILNSRGLRLDIQNFGFVRTGGIYIGSEPARASIWLNGEEQKNKSGVLQRGTLLTNLLPDTYEIAVRQDGFWDWHKRINVTPGEVSVLDSVVLLAKSEPKNIKFGKFIDFDIVQGSLALENNNGVTLNDTPTFGHEIVRITDGGSLLTQSKNTGNYYLTDKLDAQSGLNISLIFNNLKEDRLGLPGFVQLQGVDPIPNNEDQFYVSTENALYLLDIDRLNLELITTAHEIAGYQPDGTLAWVANGLLYGFNPIFRNRTEPLDLAKFELAGRNFTKISKTDDGWLLLDKNGELNYISHERRNVIANDISGFETAAKNNRVAILSNEGELWIYDLDTGEQFTGLGDEVDQFSWYTDTAHIIVLENGSIYFRDISMGTPVSSYELAKNASKFIYAAEEKKIFYTDAEGLWSIAL
ncbi:MAG: hypothetical protein PHV43_00395 [Candidatus Colwellbacteria bacterium]|nr:hypothetical protein [Candidatus Colwellbacteria bacterium]